MVSQCANPGCHEPFIYFRKGKLFAVPRGNGGDAHSSIECFWLCQRCAQSMALEFREGDQHPALVVRHAEAGSFQ
ncbi:MAG TPA: hypothetical protein VLA83_16200 [Candidatus Binatia bacterium]|nr:hypothetical protein [Candidatus Binatia bacterium]